MPFEDLLCTRRGAVARIAFNRPARRNALGDGTTRELLRACTEAGADPAVRVLVITGEGEGFCAGGDFDDTFERGAGRPAAQWSERIRQGPNALVQVLQGLGKPVIAAVNGAAVGGGATIALACDIRLASERASFRFPFAAIGITPEFGCSQLLPRVVGLGRALQWLLLAETVDAAQALAAGLVNAVLPHDELEAAAFALAERLAALPPGAQGAIKSLVHRAPELTLSQALEQEALALGRAFTSDEHREAVAAFRARRQARRAPPA